MSSQKQSPGSCASRGSSCRAGAGGWVSATLAQFIGSQTITAKSSLGYRDAQVACDYDHLDGHCDRVRRPRHLTGAAA
jgi:hypothetical protein